MDYFKKFQRLFLYGGVEKEQYHKLLPKIRDENRVLLQLFSELSGVMLFLLCIVSILSNCFATVNSTTYLLFGFVMVGIFLCVRYLVPRNPALVTLLVYVFEIVFFIFGIRISMLHADNPAVSAIAFLLVSPLEKALSEVDRIRHHLENKGYHISFGLAVQSKAQGAINMRELVKEAENNMFSAKRDFYRQPEHNRRSR